MRTTSLNPTPSAGLPTSLETLWHKHLIQEARRILMQAGVVLTIAMCFGLAFDALLMNDSESFGTAKIALPIQALVALAGTACLRWWPFAHRHPYWVGGGFGTLFTATVGYYLGELGGMDGPFFYIAYLIPCVGLGVPAPLRIRAMFTVATLSGFLLAFFGAHPEHLIVRHAHIAWVHLTFITVALTFFGHMLHKMSRELFLLRNAALAESEKLVRDKVELTEEVETQTKNLVAVTDRAEHVRAEERIDLARILHDDMGQLIVSARAGLHNLEKTLHVDDYASLKGLRAIVEDIERSARNVVGALRESELPFEVAVEDLVEMFRALERVDIDIDFDCREWEPEPRNRQLCLSTVQESLTNVVKHAMATRVSVSIARRAQVLSVTIRDDGIGVQVQGAATTGFGIAGLRERVAEAGGTLTYEQPKSGGTCVRVRVPITSGIPA